MDMGFDVKAPADTAGALLTQFSLKISGLLASFVAGVFIVILRAFKVGDFSRAGSGAGAVSAVRRNRSNADYWQVYLDTNRLIREVFGAAGFAAPAQVHVVRTA